MATSQRLVMIALSVVVALLLQTTLTDAKCDRKTKKALIKAHNDYRMDLPGSMADGEKLPRPSTPLPPLKWNRKIALEAEKLAESCNFNHVIHEFRGKSMGQNLYKCDSCSSGGGNCIKNGVDVVKAWYEEVSLYEKWEPVSRSNFEGIGHFTQVIWGKTKMFGCAVKVCPKMTLLVCDYYPAGNIFGEFPYETSI